jgi:hypothetical protein
MVLLGGVKVVWEQCPASGMHRGRSGPDPRALGENYSRSQSVEVRNIEVLGQMATALEPTG